MLHYKEIIESSNYLRVCQSFLTPGGQYSLRRFLFLELSLNDFDGVGRKTSG